MWLPGGVSDFSWSILDSMPLERQDLQSQGSERVQQGGIRHLQQGLQKRKRSDVDDEEE